MARMMVGREIRFAVEKTQREAGAVVLQVENLSALNNRKVMGLKNFSLQVRAGEILGLAGVEGNGQAELVEVITGLRKAEDGRVMLKGTDITNLSVRERIRMGMSHIPSDRHKHGLILDYTLEENMILKIYDEPPYAEKGLLNRETIRKHTERVMQEFDVRSGQGSLALARSLSGGNQQKAIVGREIDIDPDLLIAVQPTRGLDVGAIEYIHKRIVEQRDKGKAVLLVSLELDEILTLSDRIAVIYNGELIGIVEAQATNEQEIGLMMAGVQRGETA
jgi:simple sugar transport system ATP-binding protein